MTRNPLHDVAIVGAFNTRQATVLEDVREMDLLLEAVRGALAASGGLALDDVDGLNLRSSVAHFHSRQAAHLLGGRPRWTGDALGIEAVVQAAAAIATGQCDVVVIADAQAGQYVLLVGGIGIMNIMLVSVTERTREIGIRLAIGALEWEVLLQFLAEAVGISVIGGLLGIAVGLMGSAAAASYLELPFVLDPVVVAVAFFFSALVGVVFGFFPARKAARLDPIEALRHE